MDTHGNMNAPQSDWGPVFLRDIPRRLSIIVRIEVPLFAQKMLVIQSDLRCLDVTIGGMRCHRLLNLDEREL